MKSRSRDDRVVGANHLLAVMAVVSLLEECARIGRQENLRSGSRLSSLALQSANSLLSPLGSHLGLQGKGGLVGYSKGNWGNANLQ